MEESIVTITLEELNNLREAALKLVFLEKHGVGNWDGYEEAMSEYYVWVEGEEG